MGWIHDLTSIMVITYCLISFIQPYRLPFEILTLKNKSFLSAAKTKKPLFSVDLEEESFKRSNFEVNINCAPTKSDFSSCLSTEEKHTPRKAKQSSRIRISSSEQPDNVYLSLEGVSINFGDHSILSNASFSVKTGDKVGLVGPNGIGKSTLLKILAGKLDQFMGKIIKSSPNLRISHLHQEFLDDLIMERTLERELLSVFDEENRLLADISDCEKAISKSDADSINTHLSIYHDLQSKAESMDAFNLLSKVKKAATSLGFREDDLHRRVGNFSGGWKMRIGLAKLFCQDPNILLLDEPTNHMDFDSVLWLESFLRNQNIPMIIVSHDREFLNQVCNKIVEVENGTTFSYNCNYSKFVDQRRLRISQWKEKYEKQMKYVHEEEKWLKMAKNNPIHSVSLKSRKLALEKLKLSEQWILPPPKEKKFRFRFPLGVRSSATVVESRNLSHGYGEGKYSVLFEKVNFDIERGCRVGFVGPNGSGKSTMLRLLMGMETPNGGYIEYGGNNIIASYYAQNQADSLNLEQSVLNAVTEGASENWSITDIRSLLGQFMFKGDDVDKKIKYLSGGEKARVALCRMLLTPANLLILDEPTNHLDVAAKEVLEEALLSFTGTVILVSHDRYFLSQVVTTIFEFNNKSVTRFDCDYQEYLLNHCERKDFLKLTEERYINEDNKFRISKARELLVEKEKGVKTRNFGGSGVTAGNLFKGIKNAKRYAT